MAASDPSSAAGANEQKVYELAEQFLERQRRGEKPSVEEYAAAHPELAGQIRELFATMVMMEDLKPVSHDLTNAESSPAQFMRNRMPERLGDFRILREVGRGGMGIVYEAEQESLGRHVALKVLPGTTMLDGKHYVRFEREARSAAKLHHTNIVPIFGVGEHEGTCYYVMQFINGQPLDQVIAELKRQAPESNRSDAPVAPTASDHRDSDIGLPIRTGRRRRDPNDVTVAAVAETLLSGIRVDKSDSDLFAGDESDDDPLLAGDSSMSFTTDQLSLSSSSITSIDRSMDRTTRRRDYFHSVARVGIQVADALQYAFEQGVMHRDIKPANLILDLQGVVWVTDFGLAKSVESQNVTQTGDVIGTLRYMAPEAMDGHTDIRSDVCSLGLTLYELLVLRPAFDGKDRRQLIHQITHVTPPSLRKLNSRIPRDLETIIFKAIARDPKDRYQTPGEMAVDLERFIRDEPIKARRVSAPERLARWARRNRATAALTATVAGLLVLTAVVSSIAAARFNLLAGDLSVALADMKEARDLARELQEDEAAARAVAQASAEERRKALVRFNASTSAQMQDQGDLLSALPWAAEALRLDAGSPREVELHQMRLATNVRFGPKLLGSWMTHRGRGRVAFSPNGQRIVATNSRRLNRLLNSSSEADIAPVFVLNPNDASATALPQTAPVLSFAFSPKSDRLVTAGLDRAINLWSLSTGKVQQSLQSVGFTVLHVEFNRDGTRLLSAGSLQSEQTLLSERHVQLWDAQSGRLLHTLEHLFPVTMATFSPDGSQIVVATGSTIRLWQTDSGADAMEPISVGGTVIDVLFSPDGQRLVTVDLEGAVRVWDASTGQLAVSPEAIDMTFRAVSPDARRAAAIGPRGEAIQVYDLTTGEPLTQPLSHELEINDVEFSADGRMVVTSSRDRTARVWQVETGHLLAVLRHAAAVVSATFSGDGQRVASLDADGMVRLWSLGGMHPATPMMRHGAYVHRAAVSPDGSLLAAACADGTARLWRIESGLPATEPLRHGDAVVHLAFSADGRWLITCGDDRTARIWDTTTGRPRHEQPIRHAAPVNFAEFSPDGQLVVTACEDGIVQVYDAQTLAAVGKTIRHDGSVNQARFSPDGHWIVTASDDLRARLWDARTGEPRTEPIWHSAPVRVAAFSPDGLVVLTATAQSAGGPQQARLWNAATGRAIGPTMSHSDGILDAQLAASTDGQQLLVITASRDSTARVWDGRTGQAITPPLHHAGHVVSVTFSADRRLVSTAGRDGMARVWDAATGIAVSPPLHHKHLLTHVTFHPTRPLLITCSVAGDVTTWDLSAQERAIESWQTASHVYSGLDFEATGSTAAADSAQLQSKWDDASAMFRQLGAVTEAQQAGWLRAMDDDTTRMEHHRQALAASAEASRMMEAGQWDRATELLRQAIDHARRDYQFPLLFSISRTLGAPLSLGDDPQPLLRILAPDGPKAINLWLDEAQVKANPEPFGLPDTRKPVLGVQLADEPEQPGPVVVGFQRGSRSEVAGLAAGDAITHIDGVAATNYAELNALVATKRIDQTVAVRVVRQGRVLTISVPLTDLAIDVWEVVRPFDSTGLDSRDRKWRPLYLTASRSADRQLAAFVYQSTGYQDLFKATRRQYLEFLEQVPSEMIPTSLQVSGVGAEESWSAVWTMLPPRRKALCDHFMDMAALQARLEALRGEGFRPAVLAGYQTATGRIRYDAGFIQDGTNWRTLLHVTEAQVRQELDALPEGWRPDQIGSYWSDGNRYFIAILIEDDRITRWRTDLSVPAWASPVNYTMMKQKGLWLRWSMPDAEDRIAGPIEGRLAARGRAAMEDGDLTAARLDLTTALQQAPEDRDLAHDLAATFVAEYRWDDAAAVLTKSATSNADGPAPTWSAFGWWLAGPYPPDREAVYAPETEDLPAVIAGDGTTPSSVAAPTHPWRRITTDATPMLNLNRRIDQEDATVYAMQRVWSAAEHKVVLLLGSTGAIRVWLNGQVVHRFDEVRNLNRYSDAIEVPLNAGWNTIKIRFDPMKVNQRIALSIEDDPVKLASIYETRNEPAKAIEQWSAAIVRDPDNVESIHRRGQLRMRQQQWREAIDDLSRVAVDKPLDADVHLELARAYGQWASDSSPPDPGRIAAAIAPLRHALAAGATVDLGGDPALRSLHTRRDMQDLILATIAHPPVSDTIYHRRGQLFWTYRGGYWVGDHPLSSVQAMHESMTQTGVRLVHITAHSPTPSGLMPRFTAVWANDTLNARFEPLMTRQQLDATHEQLKADHRLTSLHAYQWLGDTRWLAVWTQFPTTLPSRHELDMTIDQLQSAMTRYAADGYRPELISSYMDGAGVVRFAAVWVQDGAQTQFHPKLTAEQLQTVLDALPRDWRPLCSAVYVEDGGVYRAVVLVNDGRAIEWKMSIGKSITETLAYLQEIKQERYWPVYESVASDVTKPTYWLARAEALKQMGRSRDQEQALLDGQRRLPQDRDLRIALARYYAENDRRDDAARYYALAVAANPADEALRIERGGLHAHTRLITIQDEWKWLHPLGGRDPATDEPDFHATFHRPDYGDSHWNTGRGKPGVSGGFGYGDPVAVNIGTPAANQRFTAFFRRRFNTTEPIANLSLQLICDDGAIIYLDGREVARVRIASSLSEGYRLISPEARNENELLRIPLNLGEPLPAGSHVLAISLHNTTRNSSDLRLADVVLTGARAADEQTPLTDPDVIADRGRFFESVGQVDQAIADYTQSLALQGDNPAILLRLARLHAQRQDFEAAVNDLNLVLATRPDDANLYVERGILLAQLGRRAAALTDINRALRLRPDDDAFKRDQGRVFAQLDTNVIVPPVAVWQWLHPTDGVDPAATTPNFHTAFARPDFDDSDWKTGRDDPSPTGGFGYGSGFANDIGTPASGRRHSAYFRHTFEIDASYENLVLAMRRDDGVIIYLDGVEVARDNMPAGIDGHTLRASAVITDGAEEARAIGVPLNTRIEPGRHVLAISLHNVNPTSSDLHIGSIALIGRRIGSEVTELTDPESLMGHAEHMLSINRRDLALIDLDKVVALSPDNAAVLIRRAELLEELEQWEAAARDFKRIHERFEPLKLDWHYREANCYEELADWTAALATWDKALAIATGSGIARTHVRRGNCYAKQLLWDTACDDYQAAADDSRWKLTDVYEIDRIGQAALRAGRTGLLDWVVAVLFAEPLVHDDIRRVALDFILTRPIAEDRMADVERLADGLSERFSSHLASLAYRQGRYAEALEHANDSNEDTAPLWEAMSLFHLGRHIEATAAMREANIRIANEARAIPGQQYPYYPEFRRWARVLNLQREANQLIAGAGDLAELDSRLKAGPDDVEALIKRGEIRLLLGDASAAMADLNRAVELRPDHAAALALRGHAHLALDQTPLAVADFRRSLDLDPSGAKVADGIDALIAKTTTTPIAPTAEDQPIEWKMTFDEPAEDWMSPSYDDSAWAAASAPFLTDAHRRRVVAHSTVWDTRDIWLRRHVTLGAEGEKPLVLRLYNDDAVEVHINGVLAAKRDLWSLGYHAMPISSEARAAIKSGENLLAVRCTNNQGAGIIDVGLYWRDHEQTLEIVDRVLAPNPNMLAVRQARAGLLLEMNRPTEAARDFAEVLASTPTPRMNKYWTRGAANDPWRIVSESDAVYPLVAAMRPDDEYLRQQRVQTLGTAGQHVPAIEAARELMRLNPQRSAHPFGLATLLLWTGDADEARTVAVDMLRQFQNTSDPIDANLTVKTCCLTPDILPDFTVLEPLLALELDEGIRLHPALEPWFHLNDMLVNYRLNRLDRVVDVAEQLRGAGITNTSLLATVELVYAMALHRLDRRDEAQAAILLATRTLGRIDPGNADALRFMVLHREASVLLRTAAPNP